MEENAESAALDGLREAAQKLAPLIYHTKSTGLAHSAVR